MVLDFEDKEKEPAKHRQEKNTCFQCFGHSLGRMFQRNSRTETNKKHCPKMIVVFWLKEKTKDKQTKTTPPKKTRWIIRLHSKNAHLVDHKLPFLSKERLFLLFPGGR